MQVRVPYKLTPVPPPKDSFALRRWPGLAWPPVQVVIAAW